MLKRPDWFPFNPIDYLADSNVVMMTPEERGGYWHLVAHSWAATPPGHLTNDDAVLARLSDLRERWPFCKENILRAFKISNGFIIQKRVVTEFDRYEKFTAKQSFKGKLSAEKRLKNRELSNRGSNPVQPGRQPDVNPQQGTDTVTRAQVDSPHLGGSPEICNRENLGGTVATLRSRGPHREIVDYYFQKFFEATGERMHVTAKTGQLVKDLLQTFRDSEKLKSLIDLFFATEDEFLAEAGRDFGVFYSQVNKLVSKKAPGALDFVESVKKEWGKKHGHA